MKTALFGQLLEIIGLTFTSAFSNTEFVFGKSHLLRRLNAYVNVAVKVADDISVKRVKPNLVRTDSSFFGAHGKEQLLNFLKVQTRF